MKNSMTCGEYQAVAFAEATNASTTDLKITNPSAESSADFHRALRMRHQASHITLAIADARDVFHGTIGIPRRIILPSGVV